MRTRRLLVPVVLLALLGAAAWFGLNVPSSGPADPLNPDGAPAPAPPADPFAGKPDIVFREVTAGSGVTFRHVDGATDYHYVPEIMGGGVAWLDYDNDGYYDLFLVQSGPFPADPKAPPAPASRLYRNNGDGTFTDVTETVGLVQRGYGQGVATGDYDADGWPDLLVTCFGHCH